MKIILLGLGVSLFSPVILAQPFDNTSPFIGVKGGYQFTDDDSIKGKPDGGLLGVYGGLQFTPEWSWDIGYQYHDELNYDKTGVSVKTSLFESGLRYDWYIQENLSLYGRLAATYWDMDKKQTQITEKFDDKGFSPLAGVGLSYRLTPSVKLSAGYQYINSIGNSYLGEYDSHAFLVGISYAFGQSNNAPAVVIEKPTVIEKPVAVSVAKKPIAVEKPITMVSFPLTNYKPPVLFTLDSDEINAKAKPSTEMYSLLKILNEYPEARVEVVGHSDSQGDESYNDLLSEKRAEQVKRWLEHNGTDGQQIKVKAKGEREPIATNNTAEGRASNRRVEITLLPFTSVAQ